MSTARRAVQIGCGNRGQTHARVLTESERFEFAAVCDVDGDATSGLYDRFADCLAGTREEHHRTSRAR